MKTLLLTAVSCLAIASCTYADISFERMSEAELAAYNQGRNIAQMIVCSEDARSFSRIRIRRCLTVEQMFGSADQAALLGVLNSVPGYTSTE